MNSNFLLISSTVAVLSSTAYADLPTSCPTQVLQKSQIASVLERRTTTFKHCLECNGQSCQLKRWAAGGQQFAQMCKVLFCTPTKIPKSATTPLDAEQDGEFRFTYTIGKNGRIENIQVADISGGITPRQALKLAKSTYKRRRYEPIVVDGVEYELSNLVGHMRLSVKFNVKSSQ